MKYLKNIIIVCFVLFSLYSCTEKACLVSTQTLLGIQFTNKSDGTSLTLDSLTVSGVESDSILYNNQKSVTSIYLPLRISENETSFALRMNGVNDTLIIQHRSFPQLLNEECGCVVFQTIDSAKIVGEQTAEVQIVNSQIQNTKNEIHLKISL